MKNYHIEMYKIYDEFEDGYYNSGIYQIKKGVPAFYNYIENNVKNIDGTEIELFIELGGIHACRIIYRNSMREEDLEFLRIFKRKYNEFIDIRRNPPKIKGVLD